MFFLDFNKTLSSSVNLVVQCYVNIETLCLDCIAFIILISIISRYTNWYNDVVKYFDSKKFIKVVIFCQLKVFLG